MLGYCGVLLYLYQRANANVDYKYADPNDMLLNRNILRVSFLHCKLQNLENPSMRSHKNGMTRTGKVELWFGDWSAYALFSYSNDI